MTKINCNPKVVQDSEKMDLIDFVKKGVHGPIVLTLMFSPLFVPLLIMDLFPSLLPVNLMPLSFIMAIISAIISKFYLRNRIEETDFALHLTAICIIGFLSISFFFYIASHKGQDPIDNVEPEKQYEAPNSIDANKDDKENNLEKQNNLGRLLGLPIDL